MRSILTYVPGVTGPGCCHVGSEPRLSDVQTPALKHVGVMPMLLQKLSVQGTVTDKPSASQVQWSSMRGRCEKPHRHLYVEISTISCP